MPTPQQIAAVLAYDGGDQDTWPILMTRQCGCPDARSWRRYWSPQWVAYREHVAEVDHALRIRQASHDVSDAMFGGPFPRPGTEAERVQRVLGSLVDEVPASDFFGCTS
jgi:hypothetical protein